MDFPVLGDSEKQQRQQQQQQQNSNSMAQNIKPYQQLQCARNNNSSDVEATNSGIDSDSDECLTATNKRRLSTNQEGNNLKRVNSNPGGQNNNGKMIDEMDTRMIGPPSSFSSVITRSKSKKTGKIVEHFVFVSFYF